MNPQQRVFENVANKRGYLKGFTHEQYLVRNIAKLVEELAEFASYVKQRRHGHSAWKLNLFEAAKFAREQFDRPDEWESASVFGSPKELEQEMADMQVVLFNLAQAYSILFARDFNIVEAAEAKSREDIARGRRDFEETPGRLLS